MSLPLVPSRLQPVAAFDPQQQAQENERHLNELENEAHRTADRVYNDFEAASFSMNRKLRLARKLRNVLHQNRIVAHRTWSRASALERQAEEAHLAHQRAKLEVDAMAQGEVLSAPGREERESSVQKGAEQAGKDEKVARGEANEAWLVALNRGEMVAKVAELATGAERAHGDARRMVRRLRRELACAEARVEEVVRKVAAVRAGRGEGIGLLLAEMGVLAASHEEEDEEDEVQVIYIAEGRLVFLCVMSLVGGALVL